MPHTNVLRFVQRLLRELDVKSHVLTEPFSWSPTYDCGLRETILSHTDSLSESWDRHLKGVCEESVIGCVSDAYHCEYICVRLPDSPGRSLLLIGPFTYEKMTYSRIIELCNYASIPGNLTGFMQKYYLSLPFIADERWVKSLARNLAEALWPDTDIQLAVFTENCILKPQYNSVHPAPAIDDVKLMEKRYASEAYLMNAISNGDLSTVEQMLEDGQPTPMKQRFSDTLRDKKNQLIVLNTLSRKAAETGGVHPAYLDEMAGKCAFEIERATSVEQLNKMSRTMVRNYCLLVQSHSLRGYSQPIQQAINHITFNLTSDLSLSKMASFLVLNSSYLSTLFKKETGVTLTYYVNSKRIEHAIFLLNTTTLSIQDIAILSGISDLNYFTKTFKKYQNMTPTEYREMLKGR